jgi:hypothetical protein
MIVAAERNRMLPFRFLNLLDDAYGPGPELLVERYSHRSIDIVDDPFVNTALEFIFEKQTVDGNLGTWPS